MPRIPLLGAAYEAQSVIANAQRCINLYPEANQKDSSVPLTHYPTPGLDPIGVPGPLPPAGITTWNPLDTSPAVVLSMQNLEACAIAPVTAIFDSGASCEFRAYPLTGNGEVGPLLDVQGSATGFTGPFGNNDSNSPAIDVAANGDVYVLGQFPTDMAETTWQTSIRTFRPPFNGNATPHNVIVGASTGLPTTEFDSFSVKAGFCLDSSANMYVGLFEKILKFAAGASGDAASTTFVSDSSLGVITCLTYDPGRQWIWACGTGGAQGGSGGSNAIVKAWNLTGTLQRTINSNSNFTYPSGIDFDSSGGIYITDFNDGSLRVYAASASGMANPTVTVAAGSTSTLASPATAVAVNRNDNSIVVGAANFTDGNQELATFAASPTSGSSPERIIKDAGRDITTGLAVMIDGSSTETQCLRIASATVPPHMYDPPATQFTAAAITSTALTFPATARYGLLSLWTNVLSQNINQIFADIGTAPLLGARNGSGILLVPDLPTGVMLLQIMDTSNAVIGNFVEGSFIPGWRHDLISWDSQSNVLQWVSQGVSSPRVTPTWNSTHLVGYNTGDKWVLGDGSQNFQIAELWFDTPGSFVDLTNPANVAKFVIGDGIVAQAVSLGTGGTAPFGTSPKVYLSGAGNAFATNQGTVGSFTIATGTLSGVTGP